jgi:hypothetical protein
METGFFPLFLKLHSPTPGINMTLPIRNSFPQCRIYSNYVIIIMMVNPIYSPTLPGGIMVYRNTSAAAIRFEKVNQFIKSLAGKYFYESPW